PRPRRALVDPAVALTFAAYVFPGVGEQFVRWRAAWLGPERLVRQTLAFCCADPTGVPPEVVAAHVAVARERQQMPWAHPAFLEAARSIFAILARSRDMQAMVRRIAAPTLLIQGSEDRLGPLAAARGLAAPRGRSGPRPRRSSGRCRASASRRARGRRRSDPEPGRAAPGPASAPWRPGSRLRRRAVGRASGRLPRAGRRSARLRARSRKPR